MNRQLPIVMDAQKDPALESPNDSDIYRIGLVGSLIKVADLPEGYPEGPDRTQKAGNKCG